MFIYKVFDFYISGFKKMRLGRTLWLVILIKLFIIFVLLKVFVYNKSINDLKTQNEKSDFVYKNLVGEK